MYIIQLLSRLTGLCKEMIYMFLYTVLLQKESLFFYKSVFTEH